MRFQDYVIELTDRACKDLVVNARALPADKEYEHQDVSMVLDLGASNESG